jgi:glycolate oxidase
VTRALPAGWTDDPAVRAAHRLDRSGFDPGGAPDAVVHAESADDVAAVLAHANAERVLGLAA